MHAGYCSTRKLTQLSHFTELHYMLSASVLHTCIFTKEWVDDVFVVARRSCRVVRPFVGDVLKFVFYLSEFTFCNMNIGMHII